MVGGHARELMAEDVTYRDQVRRVVEREHASEPALDQAAMLDLANPPLPQAKPNEVTGRVGFLTVLAASLLGDVRKIKGRGRGSPRSLLAPAAPDRRTISPPSTVAPTETSQSSPPETPPGRRPPRPQVPPVVTRRHRPVSGPSSPRSRRLSRLTPADRDGHADRGDHGGGRRRAESADPLAQPGARGVAELEQTRIQRQQLRRQRRAAMHQLYDSLPITPVNVPITPGNVPNKADRHFASLISLFGDRMRAFTGGLPPTPALLRSHLAAALPRAGDGQSARVLESVARRNVDEDVASVSAREWGLPLTLLGGLYPVDIGPPGVPREGYLRSTGQGAARGYVGATAPDGRVLSAAQVFEAAAAAGLEPWHKAPARSATLAEHRDIYGAAFSILAEESLGLASLLPDEDASRYVADAHKIMDAFSAAQAESRLSQRVVDRLGALHAAPPGRGGQAPAPARSCASQTCRT